MTHSIRWEFRLKRPTFTRFGLSAVERASKEGQVIVKEGLFGVHVEVRVPAGTQRKILFPIYSGMSYVSGFYTGFTPKILSDRALLVIERVSNGIWKLFNNGGKELWLLPSYGCRSKV
jgi:endoglucanase Acf2